MGRPVKQVFVSNTALATSSNTITTNSVSTKLSTGFPTGDTLIHSLRLRYSGNLNLVGSNPQGSVNGRGGLINIRGLWLQTPQHGVIYNGLDGINIANLEYFKKGVKIPAFDVASSANGTPIYEYSLPLTFRDRFSARPNDSSLWMARTTYAELIFNQGPVQPDFVTGGSYTTVANQVSNLEITAHVDPGSVAANDVPLFKPYYDILKFPVNQTVSAQAIFLPYGGRIIKQYIISQRNTATLQELPNTVVGAADQDRVTLAVGSYAWVYRAEWLSLQTQNVEEFTLSGPVPTGNASLNFAQRDAKGYLASEMLGLNSQSGAVPLVELDIDVTSVSAGSLQITTEALMPIPLDAQPAQTQAKAAQ